MSSLPGTELTEEWAYFVSSDSQEVQALVRSEARCFLYHGDCRDLLRELPDACVQLVVTSPPYNIGKA